MLYCIRPGERDDNAVGRAVRDMRERLRLSQAALGARLHCSPQAVSDYELGTRPVPAAYLSALSTIVAINCPDDPSPRHGSRTLRSAGREHAGAMGRRGS